MQLVIHVVQNRLTEEQKSYWEKTNKEIYLLKLCVSFVCLVPVRLLLSSVAALYHVNGYLQRAYSFRIRQEPFQVPMPKASCKLHEVG